nr:actin-related protein 3-like [Aedes albopictus]
MSGRLPACVIDVGTGYTKLGFAANKEPQFIIPSAIAIKETAKVGDQSARRVTKGVEDLDFFIGDEAFDATGYSVKVGSGFCLGKLFKEFSPLVGDESYSHT